MSGVVSFLSNDWWLLFIVVPIAGGALERHHSRRLRIIAAKAELAERRQAALVPPPDPQPVCGCSHHLSFHNPRTGACAEENCRCQQYIGPEPLGHVFAQPLIDPVGPETLPERDEA
ncbi:MAG: hypothetical protein WAK71_23175 [Streptosporangiaceae bacterium]